MAKTASADNTVAVPKQEYKFLKEMYKTVKRQMFLFRMEEAEKNLRTGKIKKVSVDTFIDGI